MNRIEKTNFLTEKGDKQIIFRLINNIRSRFYYALSGKSKLSSTKDILGIDIDTYRRWIGYQYTPGKNWKNIEIDHVRPISSFDVFNDEELNETFNWKNTQLLLKTSSSAKRK